jgi:hypothetical protein
MSSGVIDPHLSPQSAVEAAILALTEARGATSSIDPQDVARALASDAWATVLPEVRRAAARLAAAGRIVILRKGKPIDAAEMRGVIRLRIRTDADGVAGS